jgi:hypothetical protein|tara:strand:+ start:104 stop:646 length:543 start_codon:yes stop_codon:yes gene_type:complete
MADITQNPDYQLVMTFLQNIRPGDMDEESAQQLMAIGQRIQGGGVLTDREREMFEAVVGATDRFPVEQMNSFPQGNTNPDVMKDPSMGAVSDSEMQMAQDSLTRLGLTPMTDEERMSYQVDGGMEQMTPSQMAGMQESGAITPDAGRVMSMEEAIAAGIVTPTRPQARPMMTSPRPQMRR